MERNSLGKCCAQSLSAAAAVLLAMPLVICAQPAMSAKLTVNVDEPAGGMGTVKVSVWREAKTFLKGEAYRIATVEMKDGKAIVTFSDLEPGDYAVSAFHDKNNNGKLDTGFAGKPTEPYGFSNDARGAFGPPNFERARLSIHDNKTVSIHLN